MIMNTDESELENQIYNDMDIDNIPDDFEIQLNESVIDNQETHDNAGESVTPNIISTPQSSIEEKDFDYTTLFRKEKIDNVLSLPPIPPVLNLRINAIYEITIVQNPKKVQGKDSELYPMIVAYNDMRMTLYCSKSLLFAMTIIKKRNKLDSLKGRTLLLQKTQGKDKFSNYTRAQLK